MPEVPRILVIDDNPQNRRLAEALLMPRGYEVVGVESGAEAFSWLEDNAADIVLLDIVMPQMNGYEVCRRRRENPATEVLPVVMLTSSGDEDKVRAIEAVADDFISRPCNEAELLARVRSLLRIKQFHDTIQRQAAELAEWNRTLENRVSAQVEDLERLGRLRRFLSPQLAELIVNNDDENVLQSHRREITVGYATMGRIGFEGRFDYGAVGSVVNLAARLCSEAQGGQILLAPKALAAVEEQVTGELVGELTLKGFHRPVPAYSVTGLHGG